MRPVRFFLVALLVVTFASTPARSYAEGRPQAPAAKADNLPVQNWANDLEWFNQVLDFLGNPGPAFNYGVGTGLMALGMVAVAGAAWTAVLRTPYNLWVRAAGSRLSARANVVTAELARLSGRDHRAAELALLAHIQARPQAIPAVLRNRLRPTLRPEEVDALLADADFVKDMEANRATRTWLEEYRALRRTELHLAEAEIHASGQKFWNAAENLLTHLRTMPAGTPERERIVPGPGANISIGALTELMDRADVRQHLERNHPDWLRQYEVLRAAENAAYQRLEAHYNQAAGVVSRYATQVDRTGTGAGLGWFRISGLMAVPSLVQSVPTQFGAYRTQDNHVGQFHARYNGTAPTVASPADLGIRLAELDSHAKNLQRDARRETVTSCKTLLGMLGVGTAGALTIAAGSWLRNRGNQELKQEKGVSGDELLEKQKQQQHADKSVKQAAVLSLSETAKRLREARLAGDADVNDLFKVLRDELRKDTNLPAIASLLKTNGSLSKEQRTALNIDVNLNEFLKDDAKANGLLDAALANAIHSVGTHDPAEMKRLLFGNHKDAVADDALRKQIEVRMFPFVVKYLWASPDSSGIPVPDDSFNTMLKNVRPQLERIGATYRERQISPSPAPQPDPSGKVSAVTPPAPVGQAAPVAVLASVTASGGAGGPPPAVTPTPVPVGMPPRQAMPLNAP